MTRTPKIIRKEFLVFVGHSVDPFCIAKSAANAFGQACCEKRDNPNLNVWVETLITREGGRQHTGNGVRRIGLAEAQRAAR